MYKLKLINHKGLSENHWLQTYKIGSIVEIADVWFNNKKKNFQVLEHYKMVTVSKTICKECGHVIIKRAKVGKAKLF